MQCYNRRIPVVARRGVARASCPHPLRYLVIINISSLHFILHLGQTIKIEVKDSNLLGMLNNNINTIYYMNSIFCSKLRFRYTACYLLICWSCKSILGNCILKLRRENDHLNLNSAHEFAILTSFNQVHKNHNNIPEIVNSSQTKTMADEALAKAGLHFDELNKIRVLEPEVNQQTNELKEECKDFLDSKCLSPF